MSSVPLSPRDLDKARIVLRLISESASAKRLGMDLGMAPRYVGELVEELREQGMILNAADATRAAGALEETTNLKEKA